MGVAVVGGLGRYHMVLCMHLKAGGRHQMSHFSLSLVTGAITGAGTRLVVSKPQECSCLHSLQHWSYWHMHGHTWLYGWMQGGQTQVLMLAQQVILPAEHLLGPPELFELSLNWSYCGIL